MIQTISEYLGENAASDSLKAAQRTKPKPTAGETLSAFMKLDPKHATLTSQHIDDLQKALRAHHGDGVGDVASANRDGLKDNAAHNANSLENIKKDFTKFWPQVTESTLDKLVETFAESAEAGARNVILDLLSSSPELRLAFASAETLDQVSELTYHIDALEQSIAAVEAENAELREDGARAEMAQMHEDILHRTSAPAARRRSLQFEEPSEDNAGLMNKSQREQLSPAMAKRAQYLNATARSDSHQVDGRTSQPLLEVWDLQNK